MRVRLSTNACSSQSAISYRIVDWDSIGVSSDPFPPYVAAVHAGLGDKDQAFAWLDRAYNERSSMLALYLTNDPRMDTLRSDPRFAEFVRRIGLPQ